MATDPRTPGAGPGRDPDVGDVGAARRRPRRLSTETKVSYKTTELVAYIVVLAAVLIAGLIVDDGDGGDYGARQVWLYATILTVGYMVSRGLAKSGSREPYDED